ncbi:MAG TPA: radical SAM family heme chaperone HemW [Gemmatimonadaceae bacterium]|nr:radical SAM family heme chaperone HemW [Gemmatimonadaceae bacterium]
MQPSHLYIHVPFCARRCSYCDFSIAVRSSTPVDEYTTALRAELELGAVEGATLDTVYLGGGTPSRLGGLGVADVLTAIRERAQIAPNAEVTIEANPDDVNDIAVAQWLAAGVNRISLGAQSFDDTVLDWMHRTHDSSQIARAVKEIRRVGIDNISLDLIFALPAHLNRNWTNDVMRALELAPSHVSLYGLTVEAHTPIARWADRGAVVEGSEAQYEEEFLYANEAMSMAGFEHYEVSNFSLPGKSSRHNSGYWTGASYAGVGPSAHSFDGAARRWNVAAYAEWVRRLSNSEPTIGGEEFLTDENRDTEEVYLGLRTRQGLEIGTAELSVAELWQTAGWAEVVGVRLRLTPTGWLRLDSLAADLAARRSNRPSAELSATPSHCYI